MRHPIVIGVIALGAMTMSVACSDRERSSPAVAAGIRDSVPLRVDSAVVTGVASTVSDSGLVTLTGPMVVAFFVATQAELDADGDAATAADDWQHYLADIRDRLAAHGVAFGPWTGETLFVRMSGGATVKLALVDSGVGYVLMRPGSPMKILRGVETSVGLESAAGAYFGFAPAPR